MIRKKLINFRSCPLSGNFRYIVTAFAETTTSNITTMENCGAYIFEWRPIDCGNGNYFAILVGGNTLYESDVILNRGYDYAYTLNQ